jgi:glutamine amidotransferase-like uncharacterized protein
LSGAGATLSRLVSGKLGAYARTMPRTFRAACVSLLLFLAGCQPSGSEPRDSTVSDGILLFNGDGTSRNGVAALEKLLTAHGFRYDTIDSRELDEMPEVGLRHYRLLIVPGGNFESLGNGLKAETVARVHAAVRKGLNYHGICAGAFFAGDSPYNGLNLTGVRFPFYAISKAGVRKAVVPIETADGLTYDQYWEDGPELSGWGQVVARYSDGTPAVVQGRVGAGWMVLSGVHAEAPESWRDDMQFRTSADIDNAFAVTLIRAALEGAPLPRFPR